MKALIGNIARGLKAYLTDWKNLVSHGIVGIALVALPALLPLPLHARIAVFVAIIALNALRMKLSKRGQGA
jgi:hypothetical protein